MNRLNLYSLKSSKPKNNKIVCDREKIVFFRWKLKMACNKEDILEYDNEADYTNALDDSDIDEIEDEMKLTCNTESEEYRSDDKWHILSKNLWISTNYSYSDDDNEATFQTNRVFESSATTKLNSGDHGRRIVESRGEESEEYRW